jgi:hypothetical protein
MFIIKQDKPRYQQLQVNIDIGDDDYQLKFKVLDNPIAELWIERMFARGSYPLDHPNRFYGFNSKEVEITKAQTFLQRCVDTINQYNKIITRSIDAQDQDCLNYLHNIFELYHGLLDQQHEFWTQAPKEVKQALADLNIAVHQAESATRSNNPRFVCTWYSMPKTKILDMELMRKYGTLTTKFGTICLNYAEIGKTLENLSMDRDNYISDSAFKPFSHYSADFVAYFYDLDQTEKLNSMKTYYEQHRDFFINAGIESFNDPRALPLKFPVAELIGNVELSDIGCRQHINRVYFK